MKTAPILSVLFLGSSALSQGATALFLGNEYQAQAGSNTGTIRSGDPASDSAFAGFLGTAELTAADILLASDCDSSSPGVYATWGSSSLDEFSISLGATTATMDIVGWGSSGLTTPSGSASLNWGYNNTSALQSGAPRPGFASGSGSGYGVYTSGGSGSDGIPNAVRFTFSNPVSAFGIFGGDLETGASGSPLGFLAVTFTDNST